MCWHVVYCFTQYDLKVTQMNIQHNLIQELMLYKFKLHCNTMKATKNIIIFTNASARAGYDTRSIFKRSLTGLNSEFSFSKTSCLTKTEEPSLSYYSPIAGGRIIGFIPFPGVLVLYEMQSISSRIWTRVALFISYDDNHYTTGTSWTKNIMVCKRWRWSWLQYINEIVWEILLRFQEPWQSGKIR